MQLERASFITFRTTQSSSTSPRPRLLSPGCCWVLGTGEYLTRRTFFLDPQRRPPFCQLPMTAHTLYWSYLAGLS
jgi:hypothetical protein